MNITIIIIALSLEQFGFPHSLLNHAPIDNAPKVLDVLWTTVLGSGVVSVFPYITGKNGCHAISKRSFSI
jgi:hypothetical protein